MNTTENNINTKAKIKSDGVDLQEHLMRLARMLRRHPAGDKHVSRSRLHLIRVALVEDGIKTSDLAKRLDIRPSSLTDLLNSMEDNGEIIRVRDKQDSRIIRVHLTDKAKEDFAHRQAERQRQAARLRTCLSKEEYAAFCATCNKLCAFLEAEQEAAKNDNENDASAQPEKGGSL